MFTIDVETPKTPYDSHFTYVEGGDQYEDQRRLRGWTFSGQIWANEDSGFKTRVRLDSASCGWVTLSFGGGPDSYVETSYWDPDHLDQFPVFGYVLDLLGRLEPLPVLAFKEADEDGFRW